MLELTQLWSKALTAMVTSFVMIELRRYFKLDSYGTEFTTTFQTFVQISIDAAMSAVVFFFTWLIPIGKKYFESRFHGQQATISVLTDSGKEIQVTGAITNLQPAANKAITKAQEVTIEGKPIEEFDPLAIMAAPRKRASKYGEPVKVMSVKPKSKTKPVRRKKNA